MSRFFSFLLRIFLIFCVLSLFFSCKRLFLLKDRVRKITELRLIVFNMEPDVAFFQKDDDENFKKKMTEYPFFYEVQLDFLQTLINDFNKNDRGIKMKSFSIDDFNFLKKTTTFKKAKINYFNDSNVFFSKNIFHQRMKKDFIKDIKHLDGDYFGVLNLKTHPWFQKVIGSFDVYNKDGKLLWSEKIEVTSGYLINDPQSPYLIKDRELNRPPDSKSSHFQEIQKIYKELAKKVVASFFDTLSRL